MFVGQIEYLFDEESDDEREKAIASLINKPEEDFGLEYIIKINTKNRFCSFSINPTDIDIQFEFFTIDQIELIFERMKELNKVSYLIHSAIRDYATKNNLSYTEHPDIDYPNPNQLKLVREETE